MKLLLIEFCLLSFLVFVVASNLKITASGEVKCCFLKKVHTPVDKLFKDEKNSNRIKFSHVSPSPSAITDADAEANAVDGGGSSRSEGCHNERGEIGGRTSEDCKHHGEIGWRREKRASDVLKTCEMPKSAKITLYDHFEIVPDTKLSVVEMKNTDIYNLTWNGNTFFTVKPYLNIHVECLDGTVFDDNFKFTEESSITQNVDVPMTNKN